MSQITIASEYQGRICCELDVEALLRITLEFILARSGPTNAAIFLPANTGDFSLGAYVNYNCPRETADVLLDHLSNAVAPAFERTLTPVVLVNPEQIEQFTNHDVPWLGSSHLVGVACQSRDECLAILLLFRDRNTPFPREFVSEFRTISHLFADQLARAVHIHHRHLPRDQWGALGDPGDDDMDEFGKAA